MKKLCILLASMLLVLFSFQAFAAAEGDESYLGTWYGYNMGTPMSVTFEEKGVYRLTFLGFTKERKGKYTLKDNVITLKFMKWEMNFIIEDEGLVVDHTEHYNDPTDPDGLFTHEPFEISLPSQEKLKADAPEQFNGLWKVRYLMHWDSQYLMDVEHYYHGLYSVWSVYPGQDTDIFFVRIAAENNTLELLGKDREVLATHTLVWKQGTLVDSQWRDVYYLMADGTLQIKDEQSSFLLYKEEE